MLQLSENNLSLQLVAGIDAQLVHVVRIQLLFDTIRITLRKDFMVSHGAGRRCFIVCPERVLTRSPGPDRLPSVCSNGEAFCTITCGLQSMVLGLGVVGTNADTWSTFRVVVRETLERLAGAN